MRLFLSFVLAAVVFSACDSGGDDGGDGFEIGGEYSAVTETFPDGETVTTFDIPNTESGESFNYTVTRRTERGSDVDEAVSAGTGTYDHPDIDFVTDNVPLSGTASSDGDRFTIRLDGTTFEFTR